MLTEKDQIRIADLGRSLELILRQEEQLKKGPQTLNALEVAVIGDGIHQPVSYTHIRAHETPEQSGYPINH